MAKKRKTSVRTKAKPVKRKAKPMFKHKDEPKQPEPSAQTAKPAHIKAKSAEELFEALRNLVLQLEASGHRDEPAVQSARQLIDEQTPPTA